MPDAQPEPQIAPPDLAAMERLLLPLRTLVGDSIPMPASLSESQAARAGADNGTKNDRVLDVPKTAGAFKVLDRVLDAVHDVAVMAFQTWLDRLAGQAAPEAAQNRALVEMVLDRVDRYGLGLYYHHKGKLFRVRVAIQTKTPSQQMSAETAAAGSFNLATSNVRSHPIGEKATIRRVSARTLFPPLIVARSAEQAETIWRKRQIDVTADDSNPAS